MFENKKRKKMISDLLSTSEKLCELNNQILEVTEAINAMNTKFSIPPIMEIVFDSPEVTCPEYKTPESAGMDVRAYLTDPVIIQPGQRALIPTGIKVAIPSGFELQARPRSGLALKNGITVLNTPGTIDSDFRGSIGVILINLGDMPFTVTNDDRIAQLVMTRVEKAIPVPVYELSTTVRGEGGYGSTGIK